MRKRHEGSWPRGRLKGEEPTPRYFVPSFSIRRSVTLEDNVSLEMQRGVRKRLGRYYDAIPPTSVGLTIVEQSKLIERMREARHRPDPSEVRELALATRDGLADILKDRPAKLVVPLKDVVGVYGTKKNQVALDILGWKGPNARYAVEDERGEPLPLATMVIENKFAIGSIATAMAYNPLFVVDGLARTPHISIATRGGRIRDHELRNINDGISDVLPSTLTLDDPVIYLKTKVGEPAEPIYVRTPVAEEPIRQSAA